MVEEYFKKDESGQWQLVGEDAMCLWSKGKDAWNAEVAKYPNADISFDHCDFTECHIVAGIRLTSSRSQQVSFEGFNFPQLGSVTFDSANFGDKQVSFQGVDFGVGSVSFYHAIFGKGPINFSRTRFWDANFIFANFGEGRVDFTSAYFEGENVFFDNARFEKNKAIVFNHTQFEGDVRFSNARFNGRHCLLRIIKNGEGEVDFADTRFGSGNIDFYGAQFGNANINFCNAQFGKGDVDFSRVTFNGRSCLFQIIKSDDGVVKFTDAKFSDSIVKFSEAQFGDSWLDFSGARFGDGTVDFSAAQFGDSKIDFQSAIFKGHANFSHLKNSEKIKSISFQKVIFEKSFDLTGNKFTCIPDLVGTKTASHVSLHGVHCELRRKPYFSIHPSKSTRRCSFFRKIDLANSENEATLLFKAENIEDIARLRRLKELAESNKNHDAALRFHADEQRAKRWNDQGTSRSLLDLLYSATSDYGQSIARPAGWLIGISAAFLVILLMCGKADIVDSIKLIVANTVPFIASSKTILNQSMHEGVAGFLFIHGLLSFVFIFLIGLGFRNRFRV